MGYTNAVAEKTNGYNIGTESKIAANSADFSQGTLVSEAGGVATTGDVLAGVSLTNKVFSATNVTTDLDRVIYIPNETRQFYIMPITGGTITLADQGKYFGITAAQLVDGISKSATVGKLQMEKFISATKGVFSISNL